MLIEQSGEGDFFAAGLKDGQDRIMLLIQQFLRQGDWIGDLSFDAGKKNSRVGDTFEKLRMSRMRLIKLAETDGWTWRR